MGDTWNINVAISNKHVEAATFTEFGDLEKMQKSHHSKSEWHCTWKPPWPSKTPKRPTLDQPLSTVDVSDLDLVEMPPFIHWI